MADTPKFLCLTRNRGRGTWWWRKISDRK